MESNNNAKIKKKKKGNFWRILLTILLVAVLAVGCLILYRGYSTDEEPKSVTRYRTSTVTEGEINTTLSGSSTLAVTESVTEASSAAVTVEKIHYAPGEVVPKGATVMTLSSDEIDNQLTTLYTDLQTAQTKLAGTSKSRSKFNITAPKKGVVKDIRVSAGEAADGLDYLCVISTDGLMKVVLDRADGMRMYERVYVTLSGLTVEGTLSRLTDDKAEVTFEDNGYSIGISASVRSASGTEYGSAPVEANEAVLVIQSFGCIDEVRVQENDTVNKNAVLFVLADDTPSDTYYTRLESVREIEDQIASLKDSLKVTSDWEAMLATVSVEEGQKVASGTTLCTLVKNDGYTLSLNVDESDISSVAIGQDVSITLDALEGTYAGKVTNLSYSGSGSYITSFTATIRTDNIEGAYPGMSATANVITSTSGKALVVPVGAVQYEGSEAYLLLAGESGSTGGRRRNGTNNAETGEPDAGRQNGDRPASDGTGAGFDPSETPSEGFSGRRTNASSATQTDDGFFKKLWNGIKSFFDRLKAIVLGTDKNAEAAVETFDPADYEHLPVTTGMSDGSYIVVTGDGLTEGTRIIMPVLETTATYTATTTTGFSMGGMNFGGMGSMNFGGGTPGGNRSGNNRNGNNNRQNGNRN